MLSFTKGLPIAMVMGGKDNGKVLRADMDCTEPTVEVEDIFDVIQSDVMSESYRKRYNPLDVDIIKECIHLNKPPKEKHLTEIFKRVKKIMDNCQGKEYHINEGSMSQVPNTKLDRECLYIAGPSGSGKSTYVKNFISQYNDRFPDRSVFLFSRLESDESLDDNESIKRVKIDEDLLDDPIDNEELEESAVIFDDIDTIRDPDLVKYISSLRDDLLETGRHEKVTMLCTSHLLMDYKKTRTLLNEATSVTFFPRSGSTYHIIRFLKVYCGFNKQQTERAINLPSRWVTVSKTAPMWVLYDKGCYLI